MNSKYGDPFDGEKVSQLTTSFAPESESESDAEDQHREPGDPGTSMPVMDASLLTSIPQQPMMTPVSMVSGGVRTLGSSTPNSASRLPTKLRRIEPKPLPGNLETPIAQATVPAVSAVASSQAMTMPLTFVTVPQVPQQFHIQPQQLQQPQLQAQPLQLQHQPIQIQHQPQMAGQLQPGNPGAGGLHTAVMQSPPSIHIEISPQQQAQLLSPVLPQQPTPPLLPPSLFQPQTPVPAQQQQSSQHQQQQTSASKKEERRKEKNKNHHNHSHEVSRDYFIVTFCIINLFTRTW